MLVMQISRDVTTRRVWLAPHHQPYNFGSSLDLILIQSARAHATLLRVWSDAFVFQPINQSINKPRSHLQRIKIVASCWCSCMAGAPTQSRQPPRFRSCRAWSRIASSGTAAQPGMCKIILILHNRFLLICKIVDTVYGWMSSHPWEKGSTGFVAGYTCK